MTPKPGYRLAAEWEPQSAIFLAWPSADGDWAGMLPVIHNTYRTLIAEIRARQPVLLAVHDVTELVPLSHAFSGEEAPHPIRLVQIPFDDTWVRDTGPLAAVGPSGPEWLDFRFDGWNGRDRHGLDDQLVRALGDSDVMPRIPCHRMDHVLEGGAIDTDGRGNVLSTWSCLQRCFPGQSREAVEAVLSQTLAIDRVLWLDSGALEGDETDAHVDMLARFASPETIVYQGCDRREDSHYPVLGAMRAQLEQMRTREGEPYRLIELPLPEPLYGGDRQRLPASYANFLILNDAVLVPIYRDEADAYALQVIGMAFPGKDIVGIDCRSLIQQGGSLHCATMQLAAGVFA